MSDCTCVDSKGVNGPGIVFAKDANGQVTNHHPDCPLYVTTYRAWLPDIETEDTGRDYLAGPGLAAELHVEWHRDNGPRAIASARVNVRRSKGQRDILKFKVDVIMTATYESRIVR